MPEVYLWHDDTGKEKENSKKFLILTAMNFLFIARSISSQIKIYIQHFPPHKNKYQKKLEKLKSGSREK